MVEANECQETEVHVDEEPRHPSSSISKEPLDHACDTHGSCRPTRNDDCEPTQRQEERTVATVPLTVSCREDPGNDRVENLSGQTKQNAMTDRRRKQFRHDRIRHCSFSLRPNRRRSEKTAAREPYM